jgi:release factor glutamine methyltransferase
MKIIGLLQTAEARLVSAQTESPRLDAEVLLAHLLKVSRADLYLRRNDPVQEEIAALYDAWIGQRARRCPVAYLTGVKEFWSIPIKVTPAVLIPRPETETLVEAALKQIVDRSAPLQILDLCTGSGCIAAALACELSAAHISVVDLFPEVITVARTNLSHAADRVSFFEGDLFRALPEGCEPFHLITVNPPYIAEQDYEQLACDIRDHEPSSAFRAGETGLDFIERITQDAPQYLRPGGWLIMEVGAGQAPAVLSQSLGREAYDTISTVQDLAGIERVVMLRRNRYDSTLVR